MLSSFRISFAVYFLLLAFCISNARPVHADTYEIFLLVAQNNVAPFGLDDNGTAVLRNNNCPLTQDQTFCFQTYVFGRLVESTLTPPALNYDNGGACTIPNAVTNREAVCNNGRELFETKLQTPQGEFFGIVGGLPLDLLVLGLNGDLFRPEINSLGDMLFLNTVGDQVIEYVDVTSRLTPEPSSLLLLGTGLLGVVGAIRRKIKL